MKRKDIKLEEVLRLPPGSGEEMNRALDRIEDRLRSNIPLSHEPAPEERLRHRWARTAVFAAATVLIAVVLLGIAWQSLVYGVLETPRGGSRWIYDETAFVY